MALLLAFSALLTLTGCGNILNRSYTSVSSHNETPQSEADSSSFRVENYQELVSAIVYFVSQAASTGTIRFYNYARDVNEDLAAACLEVVQEDPLGAYAVDYIKYDLRQVVSYDEATVTITYRRTASQIKSVLNVTGTTAIRTELSHALARFQDEAVLRVSDFDGDTNYVLGLIQDAYLQTPLAAFGMPQVTVELYPDTGAQRIIEITLSYSEPHDTLVGKATALMAAASALQNSYAGDGTNLKLQEMYTSLRQAAVCDPSAGDTAYAALVQGRANSAGFALAYELLCQLQNIDVIPVTGTLNGESHDWVIVKTADGYRHVDPSNQPGLFLSDALAYQGGYVWDTQSTPRCGDPIPADSSAGADADASASDTSAGADAVPSA